MRFADARHLLSKRQNVQTERVGCRRIREAIINRINAGERVLARKHLIHTRRSKVFANMLQWMAERFRDPRRKSRSRQNLGVGRRPESEERKDRSATTSGITRLPRNFPYSMSR